LWKIKGDFMYLDIAVLILLVVQLAMIGVLFRSAYKWEQAYHNLVRVIKIERQARDIRN
jgi:hypothetical protein